MSKPKLLDLFCGAGGAMGGLDGKQIVGPRDGEPCGHRGCLHHVTHPCRCGRIAGRNPVIEKLKDFSGENFQEKIRSCIMGEKKSA